MKPRPGMQVSETRKELIVKLVNQNPHISLAELAQRLGIQSSSSSNVHYHLRRLTKAGRIHWLGQARQRRPSLQSAQQKRWDLGLVAMPRHTREEEAALIEKVVRKAQGSGKQGEEDPGDDVVRIVRGQLFRNARITGCKF